MSKATELKNVKVGDIVSLKSGGPEMTVKAVYSDGDITCQWFAGKKLESGDFPVSSLINPTPKP
ncbi:DUF2158 domain-containing protein [Pectobacterium carotovorum subsp. carotovorum]|nr:DUF2158 domain-containing protein [Pectobacterium carotovorum]MCL6366201.1 DUF2158 domain-containing protein [Pectobacterium carotovorum subsp. carotovorum]